MSFAGCDGTVTRAGIINIPYYEVSIELFGKLYDNMHVDASTCQSGRRSRHWWVGICLTTTGYALTGNEWKLQYARKAEKPANHY